MIDDMRGHGLQLRWCQYPDYHLDLPGSTTGRSLEPVPFDKRALGAWEATVRPSAMLARLKISVSEFNAVSLARRSRSGMRVLARVMMRSAVARLGRDHLAARGEALVAQLVAICRHMGIPMWTECAMDGLVNEGGRIVAVTVTHGGGHYSIPARVGIVLAAGGYARNDQMRRQFARQPSSARWSSANEGETGEVLAIAMVAGAQVAYMNKAWYSGLRFFRTACPRSTIPTGPSHTRSSSTRAVIATSTKPPTTTPSSRRCTGTTRRSLQFLRG